MPGGATLNIVGYQQLTLNGVATALTRPTGERPRHALITVSGGAIRWGTAPTSALGTMVGAGGTIDWTDMEKDYAGLLDNVKFVNTGVAATLDVQFFG